MHGRGFQTWEYSPAYAIRSYAYIWLHIIPLNFYSFMLQANKVRPRNELYVSQVYRPYKKFLFEFTVVVGVTLDLPQLHIELSESLI